MGKSGGNSWTTPTIGREEANKVFLPTLELLTAVPAVITSFLPVKGHLRVKGRALLLWGILFLHLWAVLGGALCFHWKIDVGFWKYPWAAVYAILYSRMVKLPAWKPVSVLLAICGVFSCLENLAVSIDAALAGGNPFPWMSLRGVSAKLALCWGIVAVMWYPTTHASRWLLSELEMPGTWYVFWILPSLFIGLNLYIKPRNYETLYAGRMLQIFPVMILVLLALLLFSYMMFYLMAQGLGKNIRLEKENAFLQVQAAQYRALRRNIEETRRARHDLRQHLAVIQGCIDSSNWKALADYVKGYRESQPPETVKSYCKNYAVDAMLQYYAEKAFQEKMELDISARMEEKTIIPEPEFCVLLGNLVENAIEACSRHSGNRHIQVNIQQISHTMLSLTVDNTCPAEPVWKDGRPKSSKHETGIGTESVQIIAQKYNGEAKFEWKDGIFYASVMLNP